MVEVGYGRGRVGFKLSQLDLRWFVHTCTVFVSIVLSEETSLSMTHEISK